MTSLKYSNKRKKNLKKNIEFGEKRFNEIYFNRGIRGCI